MVYLCVNDAISNQVDDTVYGNLLGIFILVKTYIARHKYDVKCNSEIHVFRDTGDTQYIYYLLQIASNYENVNRNSNTLLFLEMVYVYRMKGLYRV